MLAVGGIKDGLQLFWVHGVPAAHSLKGDELLPAHISVSVKRFQCACLNQTLIFVLTSESRGTQYSDWLAWATGSPAGPTRIMGSELEEVLKMKECGTHTKLKAGRRTSKLLTCV